MRSPNVGRSILLTLSLIAVFALLLLASGLGSLQFHDAFQYEQARADETSSAMAALMEQIAAVPMWKHIVFWITIFFITLLISSILSPELRKKILWLVLRLAIFTLIIVFLVQNRDRFGLIAPTTLETGASDPAPTPVTVPIPEFAAPDISPTLTYFVSVAVLLLTFGMLWLLSRGLSALRARPAPSKTLDEIGFVARRSLDELSSAHNWEDSIVRCYARMSDVVARSRNLQRDVSMTPDEFASHLTRSGLPSHAVQRLTRLFESVRYGARTAGDRERDEATSCLSEIVHYCGEPT